MKALVTGGNGFVGSCLARRLASSGNTVRCLVRTTSDLSSLEGAGVELVEGDVSYPPSLHKAVAGVDVVFHLAAIRRAPTRDGFMRVNADGTRVLCEAMAATPGPKARLVFCGSLAASGPSREAIAEDRPLAPTEWYGESKAEAERIVLSFSDRLPVTIARPARILGPGDRENLFFFRIVKKGFLLKVSGGPRPLSVVDVEEVVDALLLQATNPRAVGQAFFVAGRETTTLEGLQTDAAHALGIEPRTLTIPKPVLLGLARVADVASRVTHRHFPLNQKLARQLLAPGWNCSTRKAEELLGFAPKARVADSMRRSAQWYCDNGWL